MPDQDDIAKAFRQSSAPAREPLAVVGIGCRFPGRIHSPAAFWEALLQAFDGIRDVPEDRWRHARFHDPNPEKFGTIRNAKGGFLDGVDEFDAEFFGYFPNEAQRMDPQQRMLLEVTHEAMEDAGLRRDQLDGTRTAVFIGSFMYDYLCIQAAAEQRDQINPYVAMGCAVSPLSNRISYDFNLKGPSATVDTACSSSLVALHLACRSLWNGEADMAIAGGVNVMLRPESSIMLSKAGFLNPDQYCKAFDASANGYVRGEGAGVVILKPLARALADGDDIYACVRGSGVNQDGYQPEGFTVPNMLAQIELLKAVYAEAGIDPLKVNYVEAHGTGTPVGDPIESLSLGAVLGRDRAEGERCLIGSVKTNIGHLEGASGIAGFIKAVLTARHGVVPPNRHFHEPNPEIDWLNLRLEVPTTPTPLVPQAQPWTIGVNSFGAGGTNAHVVIESPPETGESPFGSGESRRPPVVAAEANFRQTPRLYYLSGANREALRELARRHADFVAATDESLDDVAYSAFERRSRYPHLVAVVGASKAHVAEQLRTFADGQLDARILSQSIPASKKPKVAWVFSGQGGQWAGMGLGLMDHEPVFRYWIEEVDGCFRRLASWSLIDELRRAPDASRIDDTVVVQPAVMAVQVALAKLYEHYGIRPDAIVGHSIGEVAAAFVAGALSLEQAVQVIYHRSQAQNLVAGRGGMLAVGVTLDEAATLIGPFDGLVSIGAVNGPEMLTLSGDVEPLRRIRETLESRGVFARPVRVQVAYHSHHMDAIRDTMLAALADTKGVKSKIPLFSTVTGRRESGAHLNAEYWFRNAREPVAFTAALQRMLQQQFDTFVEIGPHPVLVSGAEALIKKQDADAVIGPAMKRQSCESTVFLQSIARLASRGVRPATERLFGRERKYVRLPTYPWQHSRYWFEAPAAAEVRRGAFEHPFLKRYTPLVTEPGVAVWEASIETPKFPYLRDHQVGGEIVFPATGHVELAWAAAREQYPRDVVHLEDIHFDMPLIMPEQSRFAPLVRLEVISNEGDYRICSRAADAAHDVPWTRHSTGRIHALLDRSERSPLSLRDVRAEFHDVEETSVDSFYDWIRAAGLDYGPAFRCVRRLQRRSRAVLAELELPATLTSDLPRYAFHPALLDACLHVFFAEVHDFAGHDRVYLPHRLERVRIHGQPSSRAWSYVRATQVDDEIVKFDAWVFGEAEELLAEFQGLQCKRLSTAGGGGGQGAYDGCLECRWLPAPRDEQSYSPVQDCQHAVLVGPPWSSEPVAEFLSELAGRMEAADIATTRIAADSDAAAFAVLDNLPLDRRTLVVFAAGLSVPSRPWRDLADSPVVGAWLRLVQHVRAREGVPRLALLTNGAIGLDGDPPLDLGQSILHGMSRVMRNECPNISFQVIDLAADLPPSMADATARELLFARYDCDESEVALRETGRYLLRVAAVDLESAEAAATRTLPGVGGEYRAEVGRVGGIDQLDFRQFSRQTPGPDEVEINVFAAGVNFKDVMNGMMLLAPNAVSGGLAGDRLGLEVAGVVTRVGSRVTHVQAGDRVMARVRYGFGGLARTPAHCVVPVSSRLGFSHAAAIPTAYVTAWYALHHLARQEAGETVLIHSAAGGVGTAALQVARRRGARVIATCGTKDRRDYALRMGAEHAFDSRSLDFLDQVRAVTGGRGVDVVLNSLTGRSLQQSLKCLAPFGRFIELGKTDVYRNSRIGLERLAENIAYFVVDVDRLATQRPAVHRRMLEDVAEMFARGELTPPEITEFPISRLRDALRHMLRSTHIGKIVMTMERDTVAALPPRRAHFRGDRGYLITGGTSGFGLAVAQWMVERGARHLTLVSRRGVKLDEDRRRIDELRDRVARLAIVNADVADRDALRAALDVRALAMPPLAGVVHGAAVLDDASLANMDMTRFERVFAPKAQGAWELHEALREVDAELDFFVMLSSLSSVLGICGQVNYAAANHFQDSLAAYRRRLGLPATSVNLGLLGEYAGMSRKANDARDVAGLLENQGLHIMPLNDVLSKLEAALVQQPVQRMTARVDWRQFRSAYPQLARDTRFLELMSDDRAAARGGRGAPRLRSVLTGLSPGERRERVQQELAGKLARILDTPPEQIDVGSSLDAFGLDSLMLTELQVWIARLLDINVPLIKLLRGPSVIRLADELLAELASHDASDSGSGSDADAASSPAGRVTTIVDVPGLSAVDRWLVRGRLAEHPHCRLICFPSMGVGASLFARFLLEPPDGVDVLAVQPPGRENRVHDAPLASLEQMLDELAPALAPYLDLPTIAWGHSFGGIVAFEMIRRLRRERRWEPNHLLVTGTAAPHLIHRWQRRDVMMKAMNPDNSPDYLVSLSRYVDDVPFLKSIIPLMRRDWPLLRDYRYGEEEPLSCPVTALAARQDEMAYVDEIRAWESHTRGCFRLEEVPGDHWFLNRNRDVILSLLLEMAAAADARELAASPTAASGAVDR